MRPIGIDLFSGAGGLSLGFEQAGFDVAAAVDIDPVHCAVHHFNFPRTAVLPRSVDNLSAAEIRDAASIGDRAVDCVFGGAPCQGFSMIGHRALEDPRNGLVRHFVRLVAELKAKSFVFENVKGLTVGKHRSFLEELVGEFEDAGYAVRLPWRVLNAANYGTPQSRERLIVLGACAVGRFSSGRMIRGRGNFVLTTAVPGIGTGNRHPALQWGVNRSPAGSMTVPDRRHRTAIPVIRPPEALASA